MIKTFFCFLSVAFGFHHHWIKRLFGVHTFGQHDFENRVHSFAFFDGDVYDLGDFVFNHFFFIIDNNRMFENRHILFGPVGKMTDPEFLIGQGQKLKNLAAILNGAFNIHQARKVKATHILFPSKEEKHIVPFALNLNHNLIKSSTFQLKRAGAEYGFYRINGVIGKG